MRVLIELLDSLRVGADATRVVMSRMRSEGWFDARRVGRESLYSLTAQAWEMLDEGRPRIFERRREPWSGEWCLVTYSVPEAARQTRDRLRKRMSWLGFGPWLPPPGSVPTTSAPWWSRRWRRSRRPASTCSCPARWGWPTTVTWSGGAGIWTGSTRLRPLPALGPGAPERFWGSRPRWAWRRWWSASAYPRLPALPLPGPRSAPRAAARRLARAARPTTPFCRGRDARPAGPRALPGRLRRRAERERRLTDRLDRSTPHVSITVVA